jgi:phosphoribosyl 1,2-cyclic phosphodiesterase
MPLQFTVLASGSAGNASLIQVDGFSFLLDAGLGPRKLAARLAAVGSSWNQIRAVLLTHCHSDHWKDKTLTHLCRKRIPLYCHADHHESLLIYGRGFASLETHKLVRVYDAGNDLVLAPGLRCRPLPLRHDGGPTFGFRFEVSSDLFNHAVALGYATDLGSWDDELARALADVDLLALEFNHDVELEHASGRSPYLIARILSEEGHLSNLQAAGLLREVLHRSTPGRLRQVVQLHLSRDCNRPELAAEAARSAFVDAATSVHLYTARQDEPGPTLVLSSPLNSLPSIPHSHAEFAMP